MDIDGRGISYRTGIVARPDARNKMQLKSCIGYKFSLIRATREGIYAQWMSPLMENAASVFNRLRARSATPVSKPAPAKIAWSGFENARFAKFGRNLVGPVSKPELLNGP